MALTDSSTPQSSEKARVNLTAKALSFFYNIVKRTPWYAAISYPHFSFFFFVYFGSFVRSKLFKFGPLDREIRSWMSRGILSDGTWYNE